MTVHAEQCVERLCDLAKKSVCQLKELGTPCLEDRHLRKDDLEVVGELVLVCAKIVLK